MSIHPEILQIADARTAHRGRALIRSNRARKLEPISWRGARESCDSCGGALQFGGNLSSTRVRARCSGCGEVMNVSNPFRESITSSDFDAFTGFDNTAASGRAVRRTVAARTQDWGG